MTRRQNPDQMAFDFSAAPLVENIPAPLTTIPGRYTIGERVTVRGKGSAPVYRDDGSDCIWVCFGNTATPHNREDVSPEMKTPIPATPPVRVNAGAELWRLAGIAHATKMIALFQAYLEAEPNAPPGRAAARKQIIASMTAQITHLTEPDTDS